MRCFLFFFAIKYSPGVNILNLVQVDRSFSQIQTPRSKHVSNLAAYCPAIFENGCKGASLAVQWLRAYAST